MKDEAFRPERSDRSSASDVWPLATLAATLLALDPNGFGGAVVRARAGPVRDAWASRLDALIRDDTPRRRLPAGVSEDRLIGGLDLSDTLTTGTPVFRKGVLAEAHDGIIYAPMAERMEPLTVSRLAAALDTGTVRVERDGVSATDDARLCLIALDEGAEPDETVAEALADRVAFRMDLTEVSHTETQIAAPADDLERARSALASVPLSDAQIDACVGLASAFGVASPRAVRFLLHAVRGLAALSGRTEPEEADIELAARLVIVPRATQMPSSEEETPDQPQPDETPPDEEDNRPSDAPDQMDDRLIDALAAQIPPGILDQIAKGHHQRGGSSATGAGLQQVSLQRGRTTGARRGVLDGRSRLHLIETLRAAAPWQRLRQIERVLATDIRIHVRPDDVRVRRFKDQRETLTIFVVDASGSAAAERLGEAKGAVECLLTRCYSRRDQVALITFRNQVADIVLPPTRALARAKRALAGVPGGGPTPLYAGIDAARMLAETAIRSGQSANLIFLTDGSANMGRSGPGRPAAHADALDAARRLAVLDIGCIVIDTAARPRPKGREIADAMNAIYMPLPHADSRTVATAVEALAA